MRVALSAMANFTDQVVAERRTASAESLEQRSDLLSRFMIRGYDDAALRDIVVNFVLAGRDTQPSYSPGHSLRSLSTPRWRSAFDRRRRL